MKTTTEKPKGEGDCSPASCSRPIGFDSPTPHAAIEQVIKWLGIGYESTITRKSDGKKITIRITSENRHGSWWVPDDDFPGRE